MSETPEIIFKEYILDKFAMLEKTIELSRQGIEHRLEGMNNLREDINKFQMTVVTRAESNEVMRRVENLIDERFKSTAMALVLQAEDYKQRLTIISTEVERLRKKSDESMGQEKGVHSVWGFIVGFVGILVGLTGLIGYLRK
jgi:hypothetical protein